MRNPAPTSTPKFHADAGRIDPLFAPLHAGMRSQRPSLAQHLLAGTSTRWHKWGTLVSAATRRPECQGLTRRAIEAAKATLRSHRIDPVAWSRRAQDRGSTSFERPPAAIVRWTTKEKTAEPPLSLCASEMKILPIVPAPKTWRVQTSGPELLAAQTIDLRNSSNLSPRPDHRYSWTAHHAERQ
jgi:hypothetical protein